VCSLAPEYQTDLLTGTFWKLGFCLKGSKRKVSAHTQFLYSIAKLCATFGSSASEALFLGVLAFEVGTDCRSS
jgi:hypothetical protein